MEQKEYSTTDLAFAAFLMLKGIQLLRKEEKNKKAVFVFDDTVDLCEHFLVVFANSEFQKYDAHVRSLKKLVHK